MDNEADTCRYGDSMGLETLQKEKQVQRNISPASRGSMMQVKMS